MNIEKNNCSPNFWRDLLINYNKEYYDIIKEYNNDIDFKKLYLDFLSIEKDNKEDKLEDLIFNNIYSDDLGEYEELTKLYEIDYNITDIPDELIISATKNLDYTDIINLCSINNEFSTICRSDSNWKLIFKIKYPNTLYFLTERKLDKELNYKSVIKELSILSDKKTDLAKYLEKSIRSGHLYSVHILIENYNIEQNIINSSIQSLHFVQYYNLELVKYLATISINSVINSTLHRFIQRENIDIIKFLVDKYTETKLYLSQNKSDLIIKASENGKLEVLKYLLNLRLDGFTPLEFVMYNNNEAFVHAAIYGQLDILEYLVKLCGDDKDCIYTMLTAQNNTSGRNILFHEDYHIADYLFSLYEDVIINDTNIYDSIRHRKINTLKYLVDLGADLSTIIDNLVIIASGKNNLEILKYLLNLNNRSDNDKQSIIMAQNSESLRRAVNSHNLNIVKYLVGLFSNNKKEQIKFVTSQNNRDVNTAYSQDQTNIVNYLLSVGAELYISNSVSRFFGNMF